MKKRKATKKEFDTFLNYFQDKFVMNTISGRYFYDTFDKTLLAKYSHTGYYIYD